MKVSEVRQWIMMAAALVLLCPHSSLGGTSVRSPNIFFGPKTYDKPASIPATYQETFPLLVEMPVVDPVAGPDYSIRLQTDPASLKGKNVVEVRLNGELIADTAAFRNLSILDRSFTPSAANQLEIIFQGPASNFLAVSVTCPNCAPIQVVSPAVDSTVEDPAVTVQGNIVGIFEPELSVQVMGPAGMGLAPVFQSNFSVNQVQLMEGLNPLHISILSPKGVLAEAEHEVFHYPPLIRDVQLSAAPDNGLAPFEVVFQPAYTNVTPAGEAVSCQGPVPVEVITVEGGYSASFPEPGIYTCLLDVVDGEGSHYQDSVDITALSQAEMDARLVEKWGGMKTALAEGNIEQAVDYFAIGSREVFRAQFTALSAVLPQIGQELQTIRLVEMTESRAIYDLRKIHEGTEYSFQVEFVKDEDGIWRLRTF